MTYEEWLVCDSPARLRKELLPRPFPMLRWVLFDLACVRRVRDLLGPHARRWVEELTARDDDALRPVRAPTAGIPGVDEEARALWRRDDPLREARAAALRAVLWVGSRGLTTSEMVCVAAGRRAGQPGLEDAVRAERRVHAGLMRCVFRSTPAAVACSPAWRTDTAVALAAQMRASRDYSALPILADALQDAGCDEVAILEHCRGDGPHDRGCWVVDLVLGKP